MTAPRSALLMAAGTGGHIFPALALADALRAHGWAVHWLGAPGRAGAPSMEQRLVPAQGYPLHLLSVGGVRGKGWRTRLALPWVLARALWQARRLLGQLRPSVVVGFGGYVCVPGGLAAALRATPLLLHEQNAIAGLANRVLANVADGVFSAFAQPLVRAQWVGNPLRAAFLQQAEPATRWATRSGALRLLVVGGSLGAQPLNACVPAALARLPADRRPQVIHQSGAAHLSELQAHYARLGLSADCRAFIDDMAGEMARADLVLCRAGASTVSELCAVGAPALLVPLPHAVDDHQTANAHYMADAGAAWLWPQAQLSPESLSEMLLNLERTTLLARAQSAKKLQKTGATEALLAACEKVTA